MVTCLHINIAMTDWDNVFSIYLTYSWNSYVLFFIRLFFHYSNKYLVYNMSDTSINSQSQFPGAPGDVVYCFALSNQQSKT